MTRKKVSPQFRARLSEKLMDLGNLVLAGLVIGQFVSSKEPSMTAIAIGIVVAGLCYTISYVIIR